MLFYQASHEGRIYSKLQKSRRVTVSRPVRLDLKPRLCRRLIRNIGWWDIVWCVLILRPDFARRVSRGDIRVYIIFYKKWPRFTLKINENKLLLWIHAAHVRFDVLIEVDPKSHNSTYYVEMNCFVEFNNDLDVELHMCLK